jgi:hypothetical protein
VADPEPGDSHMIGLGVAVQDPEGDVFVAAALDLAGGTDPGAVGIQQHRQQHPRRIGRSAVPVSPIGRQEQTQLVDHVQNEPGQVALGEPVADIGWEQKRLVTVAGTEVVRPWPILRHQLALLPDPAVHAAAFAAGCYPSTGGELSGLRGDTQQMPDAAVAARWGG